MSYDTRMSVISVRQERRFDRRLGVWTLEPQRGPGEVAITKKTRGPSSGEHSAR